MKIAAVQGDIDWEAPNANFERLAPKIAAAAADGARLVLLAEMFATGFSMATDKVAEPEGGPTEEFLREQATTHGIYIGGSCPVATAGDVRPYNRFVLVGPAGEAVFYDKIHPFGYGGETEHYAAGAGTLTIEIEGLRCSVFICYDLRFADRFWGLARSTDAYLVVANWPAARALHWSTLLRARAIENLAYVVGVNRVALPTTAGAASSTRLARRSPRQATRRRCCSPTSILSTSPRCGPAIRSSRTASVPRRGYPRRSDARGDGRPCSPAPG
jgi:predicted amidohydrolase